MKIVFDSAKDQVNREKHGVTLSMAIELDWTSEIATQDMRREYGEVRMKAHLVDGNRLYCVVYISLRKANRREVIEYEKATQD